MSLSVTLTDAGLNAFLDGGWKATCTHVITTDAIPTGTHNELGSRASITWGTPAAGVLEQGVDTTIAGITATSVVSHVAYYDAASGGNLLGYAALTAPQTFNTAGSYRVTGSTVTVV